jgi:hypothetical protein
MMADLKFTSEEIYGLTEKLSSVANETFNDKEWELLLTIFANGTDHIQGDPDKAGGTLPRPMLSKNLKRIANPRAATPAALGDQLHNAYVPGQPPPKPMIIRVTPPTTIP